ncbi:MAG: protein-glutamate O-methyltransferase CheR, partial [Magnetococcales bacterium]|nr:protein-glutamate O-methyltransferase CheR [Magnetococcales bacterium]
MITLQDLHRAQQIIGQRTGIVIKEHQQANLAKTLQEALEHFSIPTHAALLDLLQNCSPNEPVMEFLVNRITIGESYFFRDAEQMDFLRTVCLPQIIAAKRQEGSRSLRIWSAGCSAGQETVTLAILLHELLPDLSQWHIHLMGTDINVEALRQAISGLYQEWSFRSTTAWHRDRFFQPIGSKWRTRDSLRSMMQFTYLNLIEDAFPTTLNKTEAMDLILCRNVFIYFDQKTTAKAAAKLAECLVPGGWLILGVADLLQNQIPGCRIHIHDRYNYFQRQNSKIIEAKPCLEPIPHAIAYQKAEALQHPIDSKSQLIQLMGAEEWHPALEIINRLPIDQQKTAKILQYKAKILANMGDANQTIDLCHQSMALESTDKHLYLILGLAL